MGSVLVIAKSSETKSFLDDILSRNHNMLYGDLWSEISDIAPMSDLAIVDFTDNNINAAHIINLIKENGIDIPIVALFDESEKQILSEFKGDFVDTFLFKSFNSDTIRTIINRELNAYTKKETIQNTRYNTAPQQSASRTSAQTATQSILLKLFSIFNRNIYDHDLFLDNFLVLFKELSRVSRAAVILKDEGKESYSIRSAFGFEEKILQYAKFSENDGILSHLSRELSILDKNTIHDYKAEKEFTILKAFYALPIYSKKGFLGAFVFNNKMLGGAHSEEELMSFYELSSALGEVIERMSDYKHYFMRSYFADKLIHVMNTGVVTFDGKGNLCDINNTASRIFNITQEENLETKKAQLPQDFLSLVSSMINGTKEHTIQNVELHDESSIIEVNARTIVDREGNKAGVACTFEDPSYEKEIEEEVRKSERYDFVNKMALRSSHELRNCLVSIKTFTQLLPEKYVDEQFRKDFFSVMTKEVERLNSLVDKLLFFAQPVSLNYSSVNINELIDKSLSQVKINDENSITINKNFAHQSSSIEVDREMMVKAFENIIQNAVQAMQKGGRLIISTKESRYENIPCFVIQFNDSGKGVTHKKLEDVFDPFFSTKSRGLGLGLTISNKIIEEHHGTIHFKSTQDAGSDVTVILPYEPNKKFIFENFSRLGKHAIN
ncbi:MAG: ATP-binding protein [Candidatus Ancaeobacter aquaticus]|nr:ATP-binding protein [Candidatus Ancaeobacter aquaticus]